MLDTTFLPDSILVVSASVWLCVMVLLVALTWSISKGLTWVFLIVGVTVPLALVYNGPHAIAGPCSDKVVMSGLTTNAHYRFEIVETTCSNGADQQFAVKMGRNDDLGMLHTVFQSDGTHRPAAVRQNDDHEFMVVMSPDPRKGNAFAAVHPVTVRLDPLTGQARDPLDFRQENRVTSS